MKRITTPYVTIHPQRCAACWKCVEECPAKAIGKIQLGPHRHAIFKDRAACIGCLRCTKVCPQGVFVKNGEDNKSAQSRIKNKGQSRPLLKGAFTASAVTGFLLHISGHGAIFSSWHYLTATHILSSFLWFFLSMLHCARHRHLLRAQVSRSPTFCKRFKVSLFLLLLLFLTTLSGLALMVNTSPTAPHSGLRHYVLGILLTICCLWHLFKKERRQHRFQ